MSDGAGLARAVGAGGLAWGALLLARGDELWRTVQGGAPGEAEELAVRVLGGRHVAQGAVQLVAPRASSGAAVLVDGLHAATMVAVAARSASRRRAAALSGSVALTGAALTWASRRRP